MAGELILLTGATGLLGHHVLLQALEAGYHVRCAVRSPQGIQRILSTPSIKDHSAQVSWIVVPDITVPGAYDKAVADVYYIIHIASPVEPNPGDTSSERPTDDALVKPAVSGVIGMLESAAVHNPLLRRIVVTSSIVAILPGKCFGGLDVPPATRPFTADSRLPDVEPPFEPGYAYAASKIAALNASEAWMKEHRPNFDMISILPSWIWGKNELSTTVEQFASGSNGVLLNILTGKESKSPINSAACSARDTAEAHVRALQSSIRGNQSFIVGQLERLEEANEIALERYPDAVAKGILSSQCRQPTVSIPMNVEKTRAVLGIEPQSLQDMVKDVVEQYLELQAS